MRIFRSGLRNSENDGFVLVAALSVIALLSIFALDYNLRTRFAMDRFERFRADAAGFYAAEAAVERAKAVLEADNSDSDGPTDSWNDTRLISPVMAGWRVSARIEDVDGRIDLNLSDRNLLRALLRQFEKDAFRVKDILDNIEDWKDTDQVTSAGGKTETAAYLEAGLPYRPKNAPYESVEELLAVRGIPGNFLDRFVMLQNGETVSLRECLSVRSDSLINLNSAPVPVLTAVGFAEDEIRWIEEARARSGFSSMRDLDWILGRGRMEALAPSLKVHSQSFDVFSFAEKDGTKSTEIRARLSRRNGAVRTLSFLQ